MSLDTNGAPTAESPTAENETVNGAAAEAVAGSTAAESSTADETGAKPTDLLSVVRSAVKQEPEAAASPTAEGGEKPEAAEAQPEAVTPEDQAEADKKLPFHEHPRWKAVIAERDGYRDDAGRFRQIEQFMSTNGLTGSEVAEGYDIMAKLKSGDPAKLAEAREYFSTRLAFLDGALGNVLPDDLQQRVDNGEIDDAAAQEMARLRATDKLRTANDERRQEADRETQARNDVVANAQACATAVDGWEGEKRKADPDYAKKAELVELTCRAIVQETGKPPRNPTEAVALAEQALERVNKVFKSALPTPRSVKRDPGPGSSASALPKPTSLMDAIRQNLNAA